MESYTYILFDWDGTLMQTLTIWRDALLYALDLHGHTIDPAHIGADYAYFRSQATKFNINETETQSIIATAQGRTRDTEHLATLYDDVPAMLRRLRATKKKVAIVTTSTHQQVDGRLREYGIEHLVDVVICSDDVTHQKPAAEPLELAIKRLGATLPETIMIGDSRSDIVAAQNACIDSALYFPSSHKTFYNLASLGALKPTFIIHNFKNLRLKPL